MTLSSGMRHRYMLIGQGGQTGKIELNDHIMMTMRRCVLFRSLDDAAFSKIVQFSHARELAENTILFEHGSDLTDLFLLVSGGIKLLRLAPSGDEKVLEIIQPGQTFAEAVIFMGMSKYPVTAVTLSPSVLVGIQAQPYLDLLKSSNGLCLEMLGNLSMRLHGMVNEVDRLTLHNATFRLVDYLLTQIPEALDESQQAQTNVHLTAPKRVIASRLSIKPETLSRTLKDLGQRGLIHLHGSHIELLDVEKLREFISLES